MIDFDDVFGGAAEADAFTDCYSYLGMGEARRENVAIARQRPRVFATFAQACGWAMLNPGKSFTPAADGRGYQSKVESAGELQGAEVEDW